MFFDKTGIMLLEVFFSQTNRLVLKVEDDINSNRIDRITDVLYFSNIEVCFIAVNLN